MLWACAGAMPMTHDAAVTASVRGKMCFDEVLMLNCIRRDQAAWPQPCGLKILCVEGAYFASFAAGRIGRGEKLPPQFGQRPPSFPFTQSMQNVHSNVQIMASVVAGGRSLSQ